MRQQTKRYLQIFSLTGVLCLMVANALYDEGEVQKSLASQNGKRSTILSKVNPAKTIIKELDLKMKDPAVAHMWGLKTANAQEAWSKLKAYGSRDIRVAVIDTGVDVKHPDLKKNLWVNKGEIGFDKKGRDKSKNGIDDDNNGFIDDVNGWNFVHKNGDLKDNHGHGTHIAGIIGAVGGNGIGISGVSPKVSLMILKYYDPKAPGVNNLMNTVKAIDYAVKMKAHIINYSGGGLDRSKAEREAIARAQKQGVLFVAAAGNERSNSDIKAYYPADYNLDNIISVTAIDEKKNVLPTSNFGVSTVDLAAPGNDILSTLPGGKYGKMTGTSQATAFVTGVAALILDKYRGIKPSKIIRNLTQTGDLDDKLIGKTAFRKRINTYRALAILDQGVSATGAIVKNSATMNPAPFARAKSILSNDTNQVPNNFEASSGTSVDSMAQFGKSMQEALIRVMKKEKTEPSL